MAERGGEQEKNSAKIPKTSFVSFTIFLLLSLLSSFSSSPLFPPLSLLPHLLLLFHPTFLSLAPSVSISETFLFITITILFIYSVTGGSEPRTLQDNTPHYQSDGPQFESSKLYSLNCKISSHLLQLKYFYIP